ncbi:MAG: multicopper oxidase domain-containing protein [Bacteroidetes bacterium]|nr:multicopper oxidase domain-containing protein [Bacteroidota bacterium]HET6243173.1 multicopper oxidase domain-containing protein [Bacteroidia bacterium]
MQLSIKLFLTCLPLLFVINSSAAIKNQTLFINSGTFTTVNNTTFPCFVFNETGSFVSLNTVISCTTSDTLVIKIINNDTIIHGFNIKGFSGVNATISPADSITDTLTFAAQGLYIYYDEYQYPNYKNMGAGGMICVNNSTSKKYYWNLKDFQSEFNTLISENNTVDWTQYNPDYFTINGKSFPDLQNDTTARVKCNVGDTIHIFIANTGQAAHSLHFHGFHCNIIYSNQNHQIGWSKDTFPFRRMDAMVLELVPDKIGEYSVHDHNLVAVSGGGIHPNGMFLIMKVEQ